MKKGTGRRPSPRRRPTPILFSFMKADISLIFSLACSSWLFCLNCIDSFLSFSTVGLRLFALIESLVWMAVKGNRAARRPTVKRAIVTGQEVPEYT